MSSTGVPTEVVVVGIGADGFASLPPSSQSLVLEASVLWGGSRHLSLVPPVDGQERVPWPSPLAASLPGLLSEYAGRPVVTLASGDPLVSGIATTLLDLGTPVRVVPAVSSVSLARARMGWSSSSHAVVTVVARSVSTVLRECAPGRRVLVLSSDASTPTEVAALLTSAGWGASSMTVMGDLGSSSESSVAGVASSWSVESPALNVIAVEVAGNGLASWAPGLSDSAFENDGQLTKRDLRASALARLMPAPGQLLWDVGAGAGSVGIEWMRAHPTCRTIAIESSPERAARIARNAHALGVPDLHVIEGRAPSALHGLEAPDAIFIGGGATREGVLETCLTSIKPGGRLVVHGVTLETEALLAQAYADHGGELTRIGVETAEPIGTFAGWTPARSVTQWSWTAPRSERRLGSARYPHARIEVPVPATRSARQRKASAEAGSLAVVRIDVDPDDSFAYKISCTECEVPRPGSGTRAWSTRRPGEDNGYMAAMDRWILHLTSKHPDAEAPCLAYLPEARARLQDRRDTRG